MRASIRLRDTSLFHKSSLEDVKEELRVWCLARFTGPFLISFSFEMIVSAGRYTNDDAMIAHVDCENDEDAMLVKFQRGGEVK